MNFFKLKIAGLFFLFFIVKTTQNFGQQVASEISDLVFGEIEFVRLMPGAINSPYLDTKPMLYPDGSALYFVRGYSPDNIGGEKDEQDIYIVKKDSTGQWGMPQNLGQPLNNGLPNGVCSFSRGGNIILLLNSYDNNKSQVASANRFNEVYTDPVAIEFESFKNLDNFADFLITPDGRAMIMAIETKESKGGQDLYVSYLQVDGKYSAPLNLGDSVNSKGNEYAPFISADGKVMYFASDRKGGKGQSDIYACYNLGARKEWDKWSKPVNLGSEINTSANESYFTRVNQYEGFFVRSDTANQKESDIYEVKWKETEPELVEVVEPKPMPKPVVKPKPVPALPDTIFLTTVYFGLNKSGLLPSVADTLRQVIKKVKKMNDYDLRLVGHTCDRGAASYNQILSEKRAEAVKLWVIDNGLSPNRIQAVGRGETDPLLPNTGEANRMKNRRVGVYLVRTNQVNP